MKPKMLYRQVIEVWSDYPFDSQQFDSLTLQTPDCYWVFKDEQVVDNQEEFPNTSFFDVDH